ncbi:hypothetical protein PFISCL1PPCAC_29137, partial [Pristionchus fissidentatus]
PPTIPTTTSRNYSIGECGVTVGGKRFGLMNGEAMNGTWICTQLMGDSLKQSINQSDVITFSLTSPFSLLHCGLNVTVSNGSTTTWMGKDSVANEKGQGWEDVIEFACLCNSTTLSTSTSDSLTTEPTVAASTTTAEPTIDSSVKPSTTQTVIEPRISTSPSEPTSTELAPETTTNKMDYSAGYVEVDGYVFEVPTVGKLILK